MCVICVGATQTLSLNDYNQKVVQGEHENMGYYHYCYY